jgi:hypothetical protein
MKYEIPFKKVERLGGGKIRGVTVDENTEVAITYLHIIAESYRFECQ